MGQKLKPFVPPKKIIRQKVHFFVPPKKVGPNINGTKVPIFLSHPKKVIVLFPLKKVKVRTNTDVNGTKKIQIFVQFWLDKNKT